MKKILYDKILTSVYSFLFIITMKPVHYKTLYCGYFWRAHR